VVLESAPLNAITVKIGIYYGENRTAHKKTAYSSWYQLYKNI
jgi:hypothetical protein